MDNTTIAAVSTALSEGGIGIVRVSGDDAFSIVNKVFRTRNKEKALLNYKSHSIHYGFIYDGDTLVDEVMVSVMKAPKTFTREDIVEINCHGGVMVCRRILELILKNGARLAEPGEFTKRAFLNGRIDLTQAEAVMDLISSKSKSALENSANQLSGKLYEEIDGLRKQILFEIAFIESALDDPEHISLDGYPEKLFLKVDSILEKTKKLHSSFEKGRFIKEGISTVICGKPNVGKSSLLNALSGYERAIVTDVAGTTRDTIEESIVLNNVSLNLIDTAGIRNTEDLVENIGVDRAKQFIGKADLVLFVMDTSDKVTDEDKEIASLLSDKKVILVLNKIDKNIKYDIGDIIAMLPENAAVLEISAKEGSGMDKLEETISNMFFEGEIRSEEELYITNIRHAEELRHVIESLDLVKESLNNGMPEDFYSIDLNNAYTGLSRIIGESVDDDLVNEIFAKFCMGK